MAWSISDALLRTKALTDPPEYLLTGNPNNLFRIHFTVSPLGFNDPRILDYLSFKRLVIVLAFCVHGAIYW